MLIAKYVFGVFEQNNIVATIRCNRKGPFEIGDDARSRFGYPIDIDERTEHRQDLQIRWRSPTPEIERQPAKSDSRFNRE